ncbi:neuropeptide FF receptor 2-like [Dendronephthya gigantea]|uniref:neuropeptide FF receptor 2-like n=1 Tax=Dendronephthya gigantea TaxID=151771 RepID=UPI00106BD837|nr:neuropeptide FF receptor 2-like [Dendronephthya gigantea]XP_028409224.1 neuropeptide FF receptor 2-like [Dendronephthya gigantea]
MDDNTLGNQSFPTNASLRENSTANIGDSLIVVKLACLGTISLIGVIGNVLICATLMGHRRKSSEMFILNLAITDLLVCGVGIPLDIYNELHIIFPYGPMLCKIIWPSQTLLVLVSSMTLTAMALERYRAIITPLKPKLKKQHIVKSIVIIWLLGLAVVSPYIKALKYEDGICDEVWPRLRDPDYYTLALFIIDYCIPLSIITYCYTRVGIKLYKSTLKFGACQRRKNSVSFDAQQNRLKRNTRIIKVFIFAVVMFVICMLPGDTYWLYKSWGESEFENEEHFNTFANILVYSNSMLNPFIFGSCDMQCIQAFFLRSKPRNGSYALRFSFTSSFKRRGSKSSTAGVNQWRRVARRVKNKELKATVVYETNV